ncbi:calcium-binding protein [Poseidonocella sp. HB161398]|uniref:calcium-binding protein n=1 Tax=Poseidonocella sp. HB161398 TaxID=2320855 RepID=UPI0011086D2D|nr:calcium-binding protein [Poseidonocella sp. HB161398]
MPVFLSTDDGHVLLARFEDRRAVEMADFGRPLTGLAITSSGGLLGATETRVYRLDISDPGAAPRTLALVSSGGGIEGIDVDGSDRLLIGTASGQVWRQERDGRLSDIGQFADGIQGGIARVGGFAFAVGQTGILSVMSLRSGEVTELRLLGIGTVLAICAEDRELRITVSVNGGQPQFLLYNADTGQLGAASGLLGLYDRITGAASGDLATPGYEGDSTDDTFIGTAYDDVMECREGDDRAFARDGNDVLHGGGGDDLLMGEAGDDTLDGGEGDDAFYGGEGSDWAVLQAAALRVDLTIDRGQVTGQGIDFFESVENLRGWSGNDHFTGDHVANIFEGLGGDDTLLGRGGDDTLRGGTGDDYLRGGDGDDVLDGGDGFDMVSYAGETAVTVSLARVHAQETGRGADVLRNIEGISGSSGNDRLTGDDGANRLEGNAGFDRLSGGGGNDSLYGLRGFDWLEGGAGSDYLDGGNGDDTLDGGTGAGSDTCWGGYGADVFVFTVSGAGGARSGRCVILDFDAAEGDRIDLVGETAAGFDSWQIDRVAGGSMVTFSNGTELVLTGIAPSEVEAGWFQ